MRFLLDENVSYRVAGPLNAAGHEAVHVNELGLAGADDVAVLDRARGDDRVLVTADHDFVQMLFASGATSPSLILVRDIEGLRSAELAELLLEALQAGMADLLTAGAIASLTLDRVRIRPLPLRPAVGS